MFGDFTSVFLNIFWGPCDIQYLENFPICKWLHTLPLCGHTLADVTVSLMNSGGFQASITVCSAALELPQTVNCWVKRQLHGSFDATKFLA